MRKSPSHPLYAVLVFIFLEAISVFLVYKRSIVQRNAFMSDVSLVSVWFSDRWTRMLGWLSLGDLNEKLSRENAVLLQENMILREQLGRFTAEADTLPAGGDYIVIPAKVVANTVGRQHNYVVIGCGAGDGVTEGMGVVTSRGIIGMVQKVTEHYARVASMLDTDTRFSVILKKNGTFGSLSWDGRSTGSVKVCDMPLHTEVSEGDTLISSGYSAIYPYGIPIGTVSSISMNDGINYELEVSLFEDFHSLRYVNVVGFTAQQEITDLVKEDR